MAPNAKSQGMLIKELYQRHGINIERLAYVETHGTGTPLGDSIEMTGLIEAFRQAGVQYSCYLGALKPLIGHTLVCSGLAGIIKMLLSFRHETIPPFPSIKKPNKLIDFGGFRMNSSPLPWPIGKPLCAVSSFGFTGVNGHIVLKKIPPSQGVVPQRLQGHELPFCFSAKNRNSFIKSIQLYRQLITGIPEEKLYDLSQLMLRRPRYEMHCVVAAVGKVELLSRLDQLELDMSASSEVSCDGLIDVKSVNMPSDMRLLSMFWKFVDPVALLGKLDRLDSLSSYLHLPVYPFDTRRYWVNEEIAEKIPMEDEGLNNHSKAQFEELRMSISELLGFPLEELQQDTLVNDLGLDSLSALKLLAPYQKREQKIQAYELFKLKTLADVAAAIVESAENNGHQSPQPTENVYNKPEIKSVIQWISYGDGETSIILAPPLNTGMEAWTQQINILSQSDRRVLIPVYPGHKSNLFEASGFSLELLAEEIIIFITQDLGDTAIDLVGWSLGGCLSALVEIKRPDLVRSLTLISFVFYTIRVHSSTKTACQY